MVILRKGLDAEGNILSIDPGVHVGWAVGKRDERKLLDSGMFVIRYGGNMWPHVVESKAVREWLDEIMVEYDIGVVVIEDFILRKMSMDRELLSPVRVTQTIVDFLSLFLRDVRLIIQPPSDRVGVSDRLLREKLGAKLVGISAHEKDALKHLFLAYHKV